MKKSRILIIDDDRELLEELKGLLFLNGYKPTGISDPTAALNSARMLKPDAILLDLKMQGMSGFKVAELLRAFPETCYIPIIAMTGYFTQGERCDLINRLGITACLNKPFNDLDLIGRIEMALN